MSIFEEVRKEHLLLPHEMVLVERDFDAFAERQREHGELLGEAMDQSAETFHDNNPAEIIVSDQEVLRRGAKNLLYIFRHHVVVPYPEETEPQVALGSRVTVSIEGGEAFEVDIVGYRDSDRDDDVEQVSYYSPLGRALISGAQGDERRAEVGGREKSVAVTRVDQVALRAHYEGSAPS
jgi:transcription elongation GreA/GreB family factor